MSPEILTSKLSNSSKQKYFSRKLQYFLNTLIPDIFENEDCGDYKGLTWFSQSRPFPSFSKKSKGGLQGASFSAVVWLSFFHWVYKTWISDKRRVSCVPFKSFFSIIMSPFFRRGYSLKCPIRRCAAGQGMVFWPLYPKQDIWFYASLSSAGYIILRQSVLNRVYNFAPVYPKQGI